MLKRRRGEKLLKYRFCLVGQNPRVPNNCKVCNFDLQTIFNIEFIGMFMIYLHTKFHKSSSSGSLVITIKPKVEYGFHEAAMMFLHSTENYLKKVVYFWKIYYNTSLQNPILNGASVTPTSHAHEPATLSLPIVGNKKYEVRVTSNTVTFTIIS
jgi:hypothetical protein